MADYNRGRSGGRGGRGGSGGRSYGANRNAGRPASGRSPFVKRSGGGGKTRLYSAICDECNLECEVPFMPSGNRPVLCRECFDKSGEGAAPGKKPAYMDRRGDTRKKFGTDAHASMTAEQFETLNGKLDRIIKLLSQ